MLKDKGMYVSFINTSEGCYWGGQEQMLRSSGEDMPRQ